MATLQAVELPPGWKKIQGGPKFNNTRIMNSGGFVNIQQNWPYALWEFTVSYLRSDLETVNGNRFDDIYNFFLNRGGAYAFLVSDPTDYTAVMRAGTGHVVSISGVYRLVKRYPDISGSGYYTRIITRPTSPVVLGGGATGGTVDYTTGIVTGISSPGTWTGSFRIPMMFGDDKLNYECEPSGVITAMNVPLFENREA